MRIKDFSNIKVIVVGDIILDGYYSGIVKRISPEAPVPVVNVETVKFNPGGAANVCNNINKLGGKSFLLGFCGNDENGKELKNILEKENIKNYIIETELKTVTKIRISGDNRQQIARVDFEDDPFKFFNNFDLETEERMKEKLNQNKERKNINHYKIIEKFKDIIDDYDGVIISDYNKGVCSFWLCREIIDLCNKKKKFIIVDPKSKNWKKYEGAFIIKPNLKELSDAYGSFLQNEDKIIEEASLSILKKYSFENIVLTRSAKGISLANKYGVKHFRAYAKEVYDVSGAGDTVSAAITLAYLSGETIEDSIKFANTCASIVVQKVGTVPITLYDLYEFHYYDIDDKIVKEKSKKEIILNYLNIKKFEAIFINYENIVMNLKELPSDLNNLFFEKIIRNINKLKDLKELECKNIDISKEIKQQEDFNIEENKRVLIIKIKNEDFEKNYFFINLLSYLEFIDFIFVE
ncbi:MAG: PfkB family carbohydrate kinase [Spirochaetes bacterium]|nr:PfkB family carbohydrate kinase [Spirochaetota bacterium]